jgi:hypothetical protein
MMPKEQRQNVIAKLVGARNEIEDVLTVSSPDLVLSAKECDELSAMVRALGHIVLRVEQAR